MMRCWYFKESEECLSRNFCGSFLVQLNHFRFTVLIAHYDYIYKQEIVVQGLLFCPYLNIKTRCNMWYMIIAEIYFKIQG